MEFIAHFHAAHKNTAKGKTTAAFQKTGEGGSDGIADEIEELAYVFVVDAPSAEAAAVGALKRSTEAAAAGVTVFHNIDDQGRGSNAGTRCHNVVIVGGVELDFAAAELFAGFFFGLGVALEQSAG